MIGPMIFETETPVDPRADRLFGSIESAPIYSAACRGFAHVRNELAKEVSSEQGAQFARRLDAMRLALFNLEKTSGSHEIEQPHSEGLALSEATLAGGTSRNFKYCFLSEARCWNVHRSGMTQ